MNYSKINNLFGWLTFLVATATYVLTLEPSTSFWDCGEFIACIHRLQVAHQPGAPLFTMIGKVFSLLSFGDNTKVAYWTNFGSALASGATILFLFWSITALAKKILVKRTEDLTSANTILIIGAGLVGALAYTFSDTFWFSAVESEVYAQSSLCTAIVFWGILKFDAHADEPHADRWLIFIAYIMGLSIGVHLLNLLVMPAIALVVYFRRTKTVTTPGTIGAFAAGIVILGLVLWGIIQFTVKGAAFSDLLFVNTFKMGFGSGAVAFYLMLIITLVSGIYYTVSLSKPALIVAIASFVLALTFSAGIIGLIAGIIVLAILEYVFKVRNKRYLLNMVLLCTVFILLGYSSFVMIVIRAKAGTNLNNSDPQDAFALNSYLNRDQYGETPLMYGQYFDAKAIDQTEGATLYRRGEKQYEVSGKKIKTTYDRNTLFPRIFDSDPNKAAFYRQWLQMGQDEAPTFKQNLGFFFSWQVYQMYFRYFMWNFAGRTNDMDGQNNSAGIDGNWIGIRDLAKHYPSTVTQSKSYNRLYFLPFIIGVLGLIYHFRRNQRDAGVVAVLFFFTGMAIVLYLNQNPLQPRERDYAYAGSFYVFAIWIGLGVLFLAELLNKKLNPKIGAIIAAAICFFAAPVLMASQEWDDHDRSTKLTPRDMASNYLNSCAPNAILFTFGDNDTYPLWYAQEVEGIRPDIRIVNLSLLGTDWYIRQMKQKMNASDPLPITMPNDKFAAGIRDIIYYSDQLKVNGASEVKDVFDFITSDSPDAKVEYENGMKMNYLPTKNFKLTINPDEVINTGTVAAKDRDKIVPAMTWTFNSNYVTKDNLALMDILAHNNWKRPVYFAITVGGDNMMGLEKYMHDEGFAYHLQPLAPDTAANAPIQTNTLTMYENMMNKFKYGNMKNAKYLDHESTTMFYPILLRQFNTLTSNLIAEGHPDLARNVLKKYDEVLPTNIPVDEVALRKFYILDNAYKLGQSQLGNKWAEQLNAFVTDLLDYNAAVLQGGSGEISQRDVQLGLYILNGLVDATKTYHQTTLNQKYTSEFKNYESKLGAAMGGGAQ
ncbi:DUF2723 domain-containing protein [Mucilaginibacter sp. Bleaf8]|uniref:glycosyltransferase family 117 protein n=1 Tax=Mucilaginibacter sp. Bleaf8 TaxID=2834430 RepID=UPI001BCB657B|nr:DUF2723 domain-containing protein [Mucilaginibacter sp. Bleaf8]MBS7564048.1 DUF2723 domain-containing protein [Mucilaginibacter sp. Bleaf8]